MPFFIYIYIFLIYLFIYYLYILFIFGFEHLKKSPGALGKCDVEIVLLID